MTCSTDSRLSFSLTYLNRFKIKYKEEGLKEPSGLALSQEKNALWTVSDNTANIFKIDLRGALLEVMPFEDLSENLAGLEGIALDPTGEILLTVKEETNEIIKVKIESEEVVARKPIDEMAGYDSVREYFEPKRKNKGLEGITWNNDSGTIFVLKEGKPGLLLEVSSDLQTIQSHKLLKKVNGFRDDDVTDRELDYSGICYDPSRALFWIVSDKAQRLYLYDWKEDRVIQSSALSYSKNGQYREVKKAEGVTIDPESKRLYVVSDKEARLYVFDIRD